MTRLQKLLLGCAATLVAAAPLQLHAAPGSLIADYELGNHFADSSGTGATTISTHGSSEDVFFTGSAWGWSGVTSSHGLQLTFGSYPLNTYTIAFSFAISPIEGYIKLIDFDNLSDDRGIYSYDGELTAYHNNTIIARGGSVTANTTTHLLLTRDATGAVNIYQNGLLVDGFLDAADAFVLRQQVYFLVDDRGMNEFAKTGAIGQLQVWNYALSAPEIAAFASVPEPSSAVLLAGAAGLGLAVVSRRRRR